MESLSKMVRKPNRKMPKVFTPTYAIGFFAMLFLSTVSKADILMIDLNGSADEIAAAESAAASRHEKLVLLPTRTADQQLHYDEIHQIEFSREPLFAAESDLSAKIDSAKDQSYFTHQTALLDKLNAEKQEIDKKIANSNRQYDALVKAYPSPEFYEQGLEKALNSYSKTGTRFETIIISGHHTSDYFGLLGHLEMDDISTAFSKHTEIRDAVHSVFAWGCYTATPAEALEWQTNFPSLKLLGGYDASAPGSGKIANTEYLRSILAKDQALEQTASLPPTKTDIDSFSYQLHALQGFGVTNAAACSRAACVGINTHRVDLTNLGKSCDQAGLDLLSDEGDKYGETVYCDTQKSPLRTFYNHARLYQHCAGIKPEYAKYNPEQILRQLFLKQIFSNFKLYYSDQMKTLAQDVGACGAQNTDNITQPLACTPSAEGESGLFAYQLLNAFTDVKDGSCLLQKDAPLIRVFRATFEADLDSNGSQFDPRCIPASWVEPAIDRAHLEPPSPGCGG